MELIQKPTIYIFAFIILMGASLVISSCDQLNREKHISSINVSNYESDTFPNALQGTKEIAYDTEEKACSFLPGLLDTLQLEAYISDEHNRDSLYHDLLRIYQLNDTTLAWYSRDKPLDKTEDLMKELLNASEYALDSSVYHIYKLANLQNKVYGEEEVHPMALAILDIRTSVEFLKFAWHLHNGRFSPKVENGLWLKSPQESSVAKIMLMENVSKMLEALQPANEHYSPTLKSLLKYRDIAQKGGWPILPDNIKPAKGDTSAIVAELKTRLHVTGDLKDSPSDSIFDDDLEEAVARFQKRHGLTSDGVPGESTLTAMRIPVEQKVAVLEKNIERMRWMPNDLGEFYIKINIPEYQLTVHQGNDIPMTMKVVVGEKQHKTPVFHDMMEYLVFSPTWTVPKSIINEEMLPQVRKNKDYFAEHHYKVYDGWHEDAEELNPKKVNWDKMTGENIRVVQSPGPWNALGRIKFMLPNNVAIYLHDTPATHLFNEKDRAFSHGCIRVEKPVEFAALLLQDNKEWDIEKIKNSRSLKEPKTVTLSKPVPVYLIYRTAWAEEDGTVQFREDVYGFDLQKQMTFASNTP
jgi:murein L,D-transpeptidase YcbB/YkuD